MCPDVGGYGDSYWGISDGDMSSYQTVGVTDVSSCIDMCSSVTGCSGFVNTYDTNTCYYRGGPDLVDPSPTCFPFTMSDPSMFGPMSRRNCYARYSPPPRRVYTTGVAADVAFIDQHPAANVFDGDISSYAQVPQGGKITVTFDPPLTDVYSFEVYQPFTASDIYSWYLEGGEKRTGTLTQNNGWLPLRLPAGSNIVHALHVDPPGPEVVQTHKMPFLHAIRVNGVEVADESKTKKYSSHVFSSKGYNPGLGPDKLFDGNLGTYAQVGNSGGFMTVFFNPVLTGVTTFEFFNTYGGGDEYTYQVVGAPKVAGPLSTFAGGWNSIPVPSDGVVKAFLLSHLPGQAGAGYPFAFGIRVNGELLVD